MVDEEVFRKLALSLPGTEELPHFDLTSFRINNRIFATLDSGNNRACLMLSVIDQSAFSAFDKTIIYPVPNKWGLNGATYVDLKKVRKSVCKDGLYAAYRNINKKTKKKTSIKKLPVIRTAK